ncbi:MAG: FtsW/RodA/SpoVE family cell cycle protein [Bacteroidales bacterium]|nr:FtsW/RodA/SpoVE family cell cycle protein [Bacteroidales bacterium]
MIDESRNIPPIPIDIPETPEEPKEPQKKLKKGATDTLEHISTPQKSDKYIWAVYITLCVISIIEQYSASSREIAASNVMAPILRHIAMLGMGAVVTVLISRVPYRWFIPLTPIFVAIATLAMIYVLFKGQIINGARRSFNLVGIQIQPAELIKLSSVLIIAFIMSRGRAITNGKVTMCAGIVLFFGGLLFSQGLTNTILMMCISMSMMLIGGIKWKQFLIVILVYGIAGAGGFVLKSMTAMDERTQQQITETGRDADGNEKTLNRSGLWKARMKRYLEGDSIPKYQQPITDMNRQEMHAYMAQANGGIFGVMPGNSRETARLPLANIDFVYSIVIEDLGLVGGLFLLIVYLSLLGRAAAIAMGCRRVFPALLVLGMALYIVLQAICHMAIVTGAGPVSGQPLPMISKGGTSILATSLAFGIMLSVSRYATNRRAKKQDVVAEGEELPDDMQTLNPTFLNKK